MEGLVNMCDSTKPSSPLTSEIAAKPTAEESEEIAAKWTDDQIQKEIDKVGKMGETDEPKCAICKRTFTSVAYLKSHMRAHKEPLRCRGRCSRSSSRTDSEIKFDRNSFFSLLYGISNGLKVEKS